MSSLLPGSNSAVVSFTIMLDGKKLSCLYQVLSLETNKEVNRIPYAMIYISDGSAAKETFDVCESVDFNPGSKISLSMGYGAGEETVFAGMITKQSIEADPATGISMLTLECKHQAVKMTTTRANAYYLDKTDSQIIKTLLDKHQFRSDIENTKVVQPQMVQYYASDWDFIITRAEANGKLVIVNDDVISVKQANTHASPVINLIYGENIFAFNAEIDAENQYPEVISRSWQADTQDILEVVGQAPQDAGPHDFTSQAKAVDNPIMLLQHGASMQADAMQAWTNARWQRNELSNRRGSVSFQGIATVKPGDMINLHGLGKRFNGTHIVNSVMQKMAGGNWTTQVAFGLTSQWFGSMPDITAPLNSGLLPAIRGLQIGVVSEIYTSEDDKEKQGYVRVKLPLISQEETGILARMGFSYAGKGYGNFFLPEVGDEVVLGFIDNDPRSPVILGSLQSTVNPPAQEGQGKNPQKYIITKKQLKLLFNDEDESINIQTPGGCNITLDKSGIALDTSAAKDKQTITIKDSQGNQVSLTDSGISLISDKDIKLEAKGDINLSATNIITKAKQQCKAQGSSASLSSSGALTIKGAVVKIN